MADDSAAVSASTQRSGANQFIALARLRTDSRTSVQKRWWVQDASIGLHRRQSRRSFCGVWQHRISVSPERDTVAAGMILAVHESRRGAIETASAWRPGIVASSLAINTHSTALAESQSDGEVTAIRGSVVEVRFPVDGLPAIDPLASTSVLLDSGGGRGALSHRPGGAQHH